METRYARERESRRPLSTPSLHEAETRPQSRMNKARPLYCRCNWLTPPRTLRILLPRCTTLIPARASQPRGFRRLGKLGKVEFSSFADVDPIASSGRF